MMSKPLFKREFFSEHSHLVRGMETVERTMKSLASLSEIDTTGMTNKEIDEALIGGRGEPIDGTKISDPTNELLLIRQKGIWKKVKLE